MPKVAKNKTASRSGPLKATSGNARKKSTTSPKAKASNSSPKSQTRYETVKAAKSGSKSQNKSWVGKKPAKKDEGGPNYLLLTRLRNTFDPNITRILSVPPNLTFDDLHQVMQVAFGWAGGHMHEFRVNETPPMPNKEDKRKVNTFLRLPKTVLRVCRPELDFGGDDTPSKSPDALTLANVFEDEKFKDKVEIEYEYDMGDGWEHDVILMGRESASMRKSMMIPEDFPIICLNGEGHPCAEDCGSYPGWEGLKEVFAKPRSRDPDNIKRWYKTVCANGDKSGLDPYKWSIFEVNNGLFELAKQLGFT